MIYAKRIIKNAKANNILEPETFAVAGQLAPNATMPKVMFTNVCRTLHRNYAVASANLGQCYDAVAHGLCSIALQAFGAPMKAISLMLLNLQTMNFWLRTVFGDYDIPFGSTADNPYYRINQCSGGAPLLYTSVLL